MGLKVGLSLFKMFSASIKFAFANGWGTAGVDKERAGEAEMLPDNGLHMRPDALAEVGVTAVVTIVAVVGGDDLDVKAAILLHTARAVTCCAEGNTGQKLEQLTVGWGMGQ